MRVERRILVHEQAGKNKGAPCPMTIPNKRASYGELLLLNSLLSVGFVCRSIKNFDKAALNGTLETLSNRLIIDR